MEPSRLQLFAPGKLEVTFRRLCQQLIERHGDFRNCVILAIQPRGIHVGRRLHRMLSELLPETKIPYGELDTTFHRDDFRQHEHALRPNSTHVDFLIEGKQVVLVDDVLYTGRTVRAAMDAMLAFGRPHSVELLALIDRRQMRELPVEARYVGLVVDTLDSEKVIVRLDEEGEDRIHIEAEETQEDPNRTE